MFHAFERLDTGYGLEGTGLGLALTKRLVEMHNGTLEVQSVLEEGSTFTVRLPLKKETIVEKAIELPFEGPTVLVVEDDPNAAELIGGELRTAGLGVVVARTGIEALSFVERVQPVAITLDILMPGTDGWEVLKNLKTNPRTHSIPVIIVSIVDEPHQGLVLGADDYLVKPVAFGRLRNSMERMGIDVMQLEGLQVRILDSGNGDLAVIEADLRRAGCIVHREHEFSELEMREHSSGVRILDLTHDLSLALQYLDWLETAPNRPPTIALVDENVPVLEGWPAKIHAIASKQAVRSPEKLIRIIHRILKS